MPERVPDGLRVTPAGRDPVSVKLSGLSPAAVTENVPAVFSARVVEGALVKTGGPLATVRVKAWAAVRSLASVTVTVSG